MIQDKNPERNIMATAFSGIQTKKRIKEDYFEIEAVDLIKIKSIEDKLNKIFIEDEKLDSPVFLFISDNIIHKIAYYLAGYVKRPVALGVAGATASGKSTFVYDVIESVIDFQKKIGIKPSITRINADDYYFDRSENVKKAGGFQQFAKTYDFDVPESIDLALLKLHIENMLLCNCVKLPKYMMDGTCVRHDNHILAMPTKIIISEGLFNLRDGIKDVFDFSIYVHVNKEPQKKRWYIRARTRGLTGESAEKVYNKAMLNAEVYVNPTINNADIVINGEALRDDYKAVANKFSDLILDLYSQAQTTL